MKLAKRLFSPKKDPPPAAAAAPAAAPAPPACPPQLSPANLIVALDHVLASEGDEEWCERLAVLTTSALFLLDRSGEDDPLAPFGQPLGRIRLAEDLAEVVLVNTREHNPDGSSTPSFTQLELRTSTLFGRDLLLRGVPGAADVHQWAAALSEQQRLAQAEHDDGRHSDSEERRPSPPPAGDRDDWPWNAAVAADVDAMGRLEKKRDGPLDFMGGWVERHFLLREGAGLLLYYCRAHDVTGWDVNDELLGELRGAIELAGATLEEVPADDQDPDATPGCLTPFTGEAADADPSVPTTALRITAREEPEAQLFPQRPRRLGVLTVRAATPTLQQLWKERLRAAIRHANAVPPSPRTAARLAAAASSGGAPAAAETPPPLTLTPPTPEGGHWAGPVALVHAAWVAKEYAPDSIAATWLPWAWVFLANAIAAVLFYRRLRYVAAAKEYMAEVERVEQEALEESIELALGRGPGAAAAGDGDEASAPSELQPGDEGFVYPGVREKLDEHYQLWCDMWAEHNRRVAAGEDVTDSEWARSQRKEYNRPPGVAAADWERAPPLPDSGGDWERRLGVETIVQDEFDEEPLESMLRRRKGAGFGE